MFRAPLSQVLGDIFVVVLLLAFPFLLLVWFCEVTTVATVVAVFSVLAFWASLKRSGPYWKIRVAEDALYLGGTYLGNQIPYDMIEFVRAGSILENLGPHASASAPVRIKVGRKRYSFRLRRGDARRCLETLMARAPGAEGLDVVGAASRRSVEAEVREYRPAVRTAQYFLTSGFWLLGGGVLLLAALAYKLIRPGEQGLDDTVVRGLVKVAALALSMCGLGWFLLRRGLARRRQAQDRQE